jgi:hypothetical protein
VVFKGNTSTSATSTAVNIPQRILSFSLVNKSGGAITVNAGVLYGSTIMFAPLNSALAAGEAYIYSGNPITLEADHQVYVEATGSCDYYFTLEPLKLIDNVKPEK